MPQIVDMGGVGIVQSCGLRLNLENKVHLMAPNLNENFVTEADVLPKSHLQAIEGEVQAVGRSI